MIIAIWGCGGVGKTTIASALGSIYARKDTVGVIDTCLSHPTLPVHLPEKKLDAELSLGRFLNRLGSNEIRPYFHQSPACDGLFFAGLSDGDSYTDFEIGLEAADRARDFLLQSEKMLGTVILDCSVQRNDPFLPVMLREADIIILPIVPNVDAVYWFSSIKPMLSNAGVLAKTIPVAVMTMPFHLIDEVEKQLDMKFAAEFRFCRDVAQTHDECRLATEANRKDGLIWSNNLHKLHQEIENRLADAAFEPVSEVIDG